MVDTPVVAPPPATPPPAMPPSVSVRPSNARFVLVVLLPVMALVAAVFWLFTVDRAVSATTDHFTVGYVPGTVTVNAHPDTWYIYATTGSDVGKIQVTDPSGQPIPVKASSAGSYMSGGRDYRAVGQFSLRPGQIGDFRVAVSSNRPSGFGDQFAVGNFSVNGFRNPQLWAVAALEVVNFGAAIAIALWPVLRGRRAAGARL